MKIKIEIKHRITGSVLFEFEKENNTVKDTVIEARRQGADLQGADLQGADLRGADLQGADLQGADLQVADLRGADLQGADLQGADLQGAYLRGADLQGADLQGVKLGVIEIEKMAVFSGLYNYQVWAIVAKDGTKYIRMGCRFRSVEEWEADFWNNQSEFPNNGSEKSNLRLFAYETAKMWLQIITKP